MAVGLLTPFDEGGEIQHDHLASNAEKLHERGVTTFLACANVSEYHSLSHDERIAVTETSVEALPEAYVLAGVGGSTGDAVELIESYDSIGIDAHMVMPPDHTFTHERGLVRYYRQLAAAAEHPLVPYIRGFSPSVETLVAIAEIDGVGGIKYALEDVPLFAAAQAQAPDDVVWLEGMAEPWAIPFWAAGVDGFTAGVSNFVPELGLELLDALQAENWERARELQNAALPYQRLRSERGKANMFPGANSVPALKYGLELSGFHGGASREPLVELSETDKERARTHYERICEAVEQ
ncbi:dihydrodipicolinate synthase family protein [Haloarchaeobius sp. TZWSO28]|uniref:dihydrodipicolinate synthase family protein n=1 Tax=Haloarchaeobius sp. TZWSO28 TaxID=3446119 RepID=UPI003EB70F49